MTIRRRLTLSFAIVLVLFGVSTGVYLWSAHLRGVTMKRLDRTLQRRVVLATIRQDVDNLQKQVALLSQSELAPEALQAEDLSNLKTHQLFDEKADGFEAFSVADATKKADVLLIELADPARSAFCSLFANPYPRDDGRGEVVRLFRV